MRYFTLVTQDYWTAKNQLEKDVKSCMRSFEHLILENDEERQQLITQLYFEISELNKKHTRCKPIKLELHDDMFYVSGVSYLTIYKAREK